MTRAIPAIAVERVSEVGSSLRLPFPLLDLRFEAALEGPLALPPYPGGLLRGAFGAALRQLSCMTGFRTCVGCPLRATCPYPLLFEPPPADLAPVGLPRAQDGLPPPFILRLPEADPGPDGQFSFGMRLVGHGIERLAYVIEAWRRVFARGLGQERVRGELVAVRAAGAGDPVWEGEEILRPPPVAPTLEPAGAQVALVTRTPLRLQREGRPYDPAAVTPRAFIAAVIRRARLLAIHAGDEAQAEVAQWPVADWLALADGIGHRPALAWRNWHRFSARQRQRMNLGGLVGQWAWAEVPEPVQALLRLGELLHVGKEASFGLGAFEIRSLEPAPG